MLIKRGSSPRPISEYITKEKNGYNWIKISDAPKYGEYITKTKEKIRPEGLAKTLLVEKGDLILSNSMSFGKPYIVNICGCIHDGWLLIRNEKNIIDTKFLSALLSTTKMFKAYKMLAAGSTVNNLNKNLINKLNVKTPQIIEQKIISQIFEKFNFLITLHQSYWLCFFFIISCNFLKFKNYFLAERK
ncbi:restriction endonuclease subunit S [Metamycoplasma neophronis]|uniref:Restriction endonuclease subunit S n=1 Tax=Metamycoplasma neophronis TaxID=872983 RepID=A0ABY2Z3T0_9BACT|nr:restriction endonuclease subunit S [Metamycoplasma neophronis]